MAQGVRPFQYQGQPHLAGLTAHTKSEYAIAWATIQTENPTKNLAEGHLIFIHFVDVGGIIGGNRSGPKR